MCLLLILSIILRDSQGSSIDQSQEHVTVTNALVAGLEALRRVQDDEVHEMWSQLDVTILVHWDAGIAELN
ncbi:uncharacterized protein RSE6_01703 [Rhynchosporium secalis]|uniref:Uncharacterized protein n=1 Tax=Rhynchosporium secalis TaxID=38038 RepID=A0A1E1LYD8_RHYSE|nr:uncharacterized protein RSE6_01703 [Rhynchosporium secalis]